MHQYFVHALATIRSHILLSSCNQIDVKCVRSVWLPEEAERNEMKAEQQQQQQQQQQQTAVKKSSVRRKRSHPLTVVHEEKRPPPKKPEYDRDQVREYMRKQQLEKHKKVAHTPHTCTHRALSNHRSAYM